MVAVAAMFAGNAQAGLARMNATCPGKLEVHVDQGGPVYVNGKEATLKRFNDNYYEAKDAVSGVTISISNNPDGSSDMSYTGKNRANGICQIAKDAPAATTAAARSLSRSPPRSLRAKPIRPRRRPAWSRLPRRPMSPARNCR